MARFTQYPLASTGDYAEATTFLIANEDGEIKQASLEGLRSNFGCDIRCASLVIPSAQVLQLNTTPQTIVPAQGVGTAIEVISATLKIDFNSVAYLTNTNIQLIVNNADEGQVLGTIQQSSSSIALFEFETGTSGAVQLVDNEPLLVKVPTGNPTAGDSDIEVFVLYRLINV